VAEVFRPRNQRPALPVLTTNAALDDFLRSAMLNQPQVEAAYYEWAAAVQRITRERSLPDPRLVFETDHLVRELELIARKQQEVGKVTLQDVLRAQIEESRLDTELANLDDSRNPLFAQFKGALGLRAEATNPPVMARLKPRPWIWMASDCSRPHSREIHG